MFATALAPLTNPSSYLWYPFQCSRADRNTTSTVCLIPAARGYTFLRGGLKCKKHSFTPGDYEVSTFLSTRKKRLEEVVLDIHVDKDRTFHLPVLVDEDFDINLKIDHFGEAKKNLKNLKYKLAFTDNGSDQVRINGLIGVDIIQFMDMKMIKCMNGIAWEFPTGIAPPWVIVIISSTRNRLSGRECSGEQLSDYHYSLFLLSQGASKFCFTPSPKKNLSRCVFRMFK